MDLYKIEDNVPLPNTKRLRKLLEEMKIGSSVLVTKKESGTVYAWLARHGFGCTRKPEGEAVRCWKTIAVPGHGVARRAASAKMRRYELIAIAERIGTAGVAVVPTSQVGTLGQMIAAGGRSYTDKPAMREGWSVVTVA